MSTSEGMAEGASANDKTRVTGGTARGTGVRGTAGKLSAAWKSVAVTATRRRMPPQPRRRRSGDTDGEFRKLARKFSGRFADMRQDFKARAAITGRSITIDPQAYEAAALSLSDTFAQLNLLNDDTGSDSDFNEGFDNNENGISLRL
jgi:hypothetical protein